MKVSNLVQVSTVAIVAFGGLCSCDDASINALNSGIQSALAMQGYGPGAVRSYVPAPYSSAPVDIVTPYFQDWTRSNCHGVPGGPVCAVQ